MRFGLDISPAGAWGSPRELARLAGLAEASGWDGVFLEDYVFYKDGLDAYDPWVALAAVALATERVRIGTLVTPVPRRRPWKLAAEAVAIDHLSGGRLILGVGSGDPESADLTAVGEERGLRERAALLDEGLAVIDALWRGEPVVHRGERFRLDGVSLRPRPVQRPRIPIWVGGQLTRRGPRERALRWDGAALYRALPPQWEDITPAEVRTLRAARPDEAFAIAIGGRRHHADEAAERAYVAEIAQAGATWWHEFVPPTTPLAEVEDRIRRGPLSPG